MAGGGHDSYRVKGSSISSKLRYVRDEFGREAELALIGRFDPSYFPILDSSWYPYAFYAALIQAIADEHLDGDLERLREVGAHSAKAVLTGIYKLFATGNKDFVDFLRRAETLHETCYSEGGMRVTVDDDRKGCEIWLSAPIFREVDMQIAAGFYSGAAELFGAEQVRCTARLDSNAATFAMTWR